jgi:hypothetical protein
MAIKINIEDESVTPPPESDIKLIVKDERDMSPLKMNLEIRKSIDGSLMIFDHPHMDIVVVPQARKIVAFAKGAYSEEVYAAQSRLLEHLTRAGILSRESIQAGNVYGALEGAFLESKNADLPVIDLSVLSIGKFIEKEKPEYIFQDAYEQEVEDMYVEPSNLDSTPLGKVPQSDNKGGIQAYDVRRYLAGI